MRGHPRGLLGLFFTEVWERFSYYGMRALLLYYMYDQVAHGGLGMDPATARSLVTVYGSLVYMSAILGGWLSDRLLGDRRGTLAGGVLIMCGHVCLAVPGGAPALFGSMVLIALGTGLLKPTASASVGDLYAADDPRRDSGFSLYYMGISVGALVAPLTVGTVGQQYDYHLGFGMAAVGMAIGLVVYLATQRNLAPASLAPKNPLRRGELRGRPLVIAGVAVVAVMVAAAVTATEGLLTAGVMIDAITVASLALPAAYFTVMLRSPRTTPAERSRLIGYIPLFVAAVCFWAIQEQGATVIAQYAEQSTDLQALGFAIPSSWFQSVGSLVLILLTPAFVRMWPRLARRPHPPSTAHKFGAGLTLAGVSYLMMIVPTLMTGKSNPLWLVASLAVVTIGEMCLSPIGLSATSRLAPAAFASQTMGLWLSSNAAGQGIGAQLVALYDPGSAAWYFGGLGAGAAALGLVLFAFARVLRRRADRAEATVGESGEASRSAVRGR